MYVCMYVCMYVYMFAKRHQQSRSVLPPDLSSPTFRNGCRTHLSSLVINVKILAKHSSHRLATEYRLLNTKEQPTNSRYNRHDSRNSTISTKYRYLACITFEERSKLSSYVDTGLFAQVLQFPLTQELD
ncbi:uncharacterized protein LOC143152764 [Ptiloglossa arizonensis]|uniref:uncharacterized protein LOC143152764 n=1 Tax=Ptiloglossa arizonensis TaxID=3350558 RepID=UPI003FA0AE6D